MLRIKGLVYRKVSVDLNGRARENRSRAPHERAGGPAWVAEGTLHGEDHRHYQHRAPHRWDAGLPHVCA